MMMMMKLMKLMFMLRSVKQKPLKFLATVETGKAV